LQKIAAKNEKHCGNFAPEIAAKLRENNSPCVASLAETPTREA